MTSSRPGPSARVYVGDELAGLLSQVLGDFLFTYDEAYLAAAGSKRAGPVSLLMPLKHREYRSSGRLHPFFAGLMQEGWLRGLADREGAASGVLDYLVRYCGDAIGDVAIGPGSTPEAPRTSPLEVQSDVRAKPVVARERCLVCLAGLPSPGHNLNYHAACSEELFGSARPPRFDLDPDAFERVAVASLTSGIALPGMQKKIPVHYRDGDAHYILKPQVEKVRAVPETEHLWMRLARELGIVTARCGLVEIADGTLVYVTKRFDRTAEGGKLHMEDFAQLTGKGPLELEKFEGAMRDIATVLRRFAKPWKTSVDRLARLMLFNHVFGNHDAHLKNFSIIGLPKPGGVGVTYQLSPAYDLLPTSFINGRGPQSALDINGKRKDIVMADLLEEVAAMGVPRSRVEAFFVDLVAKAATIETALRQSYVPEGIASEYSKQINKRLRSLGRAVLF
jgi:serine/threonine-protein kinase HipA